MKYIVRAYATAPSTVQWDEQQESEYYQALKDTDNIKDIEHPFVGKLHPYNDDWFLANIDPEWKFVFTSIPGVMGNLSKDSTFGIASNNEQGRQAALEFYQQAQAAVLKLNTHLNRQAVSHVKVHTAPIHKDNASSIQALQTSLEVMQSWDWHGANLLIEHCDAFIDGQLPEKGFLSIEDEINAINYVNNKLQCDIGISINWGRSAIEARGCLGPIDHIKKADKANLLKGIIFSGASAQDSPYGIWKDSHMPPAQSFNIPGYAQKSFLTVEQIEKCFGCCDAQHLAFIGGKISVSPNDISVEQRVSYNKSLLTLLDKALA